MVMERTGSSENPMGHVQENFALIDFSDESNLAQFISLSRGESETAHFNSITSLNQVLDIQYDHFNIPPTTTFPNQHSHFNHLSNNCEVLKEAPEDPLEYSSGTMTTTSMPPTKRSRKGDRSRTLIQEQRRRSRMKEKLYALRALVPNITKMDKASIVGDAALYVQDLQMQAKKLKAEVASLESSLTRMDRQQGGVHDIADKFQIAYQYPTIRIILQIGVFQLEENGYYVRVVSNKGYGVAASLYKALESLSTFVLHSSNLATINDTFHLTFTLNVREGQSDMNVPNLKLWVAAAFLNQGFDIPQSL
ncbi:transcription factor FER-LIKE IRON DEFICIENCY-INDUCED TRANSCRIPTION FACTOR-like [Apium graveolens]|uniref:transcription factor FER-LIKE IRON DEFICIENCY-INDUCED TRANSCRIPTION FACTOR-like n=1 Tax=Apium graveolens TaxID=4045 RepID=UPI003D7BD0D0